MIHAATAGFRIPCAIGHESGRRLHGHPLDHDGASPARWVDAWLTARAVSAQREGGPLFDGCVRVRRRQLAMTVT